MIIIVMCQVPGKRISYAQIPKLWVLGSVDTTYNRAVPRNMCHVCNLNYSSNDI
jgi:hypothetical protein